MLLDDIANIALICLIIGVGAGITIAVLIAYVTALAFLEDHID